MAKPTPPPSSDSSWDIAQKIGLSCPSQTFHCPEIKIEFYGRDEKRFLTIFCRERSVVTSPHSLGQTFGAILVKKEERVEMAGRAHSHPRRGSQRPKWRRRKFHSSENCYRLSVSQLNLGFGAIIKPEPDRDRDQDRSVTNKLLSSLCSEPSS